MQGYTVVGDAFSIWTPCADVKPTLTVMDGLLMTICLLDPPLHESVPQGKEECEKPAGARGITVEALAKRADDLHENSPMRGHCGVCLGVAYPEVSEAGRVRGLARPASACRARRRRQCS
jgi:hypothetical protein